MPPWPGDSGTIALFTDKTVSEFLSTELQPSLPFTYLLVQPNSAEGKIRDHLTSCKCFSGRASEIVTDLQAILDRSVTKPSTLTARHMAAVDDEAEVSEDQAEDGEGEDDFFDQLESCDDKIDDDTDGWESGSVHSVDDGLPIGLPTTPTNSNANSGSDSGSGNDDDKSAPDSDSDTSLLSPKVPKASRGAGTSTFLPSLSVILFPVPETHIRKMNWKPWKARAGGRTAEVNELGERTFHPLSLSQTALIIKCSRIWEKKYRKGAKHVVKQQQEETEKERMKEEKHRQREAAAKCPHWVTKRVFEPPRRTDSGYGGRMAAKSSGGSGRGRERG